MVKRNMLRVGLLVVLVVTCGCSVLTKSQVKEVTKFATAAKGYDELPGTIIAEHVKVRKSRRVMSAAYTFSGDKAVKEIENALQQEKELGKRGQEADAALNVLKEYGELLVKLTADEYNDSLQASSETLAKNIDNGISEYNKKTGKSLNLFGAGVAAIVRGIGGIYVKSEQQKALKQAVISADPIVESLTAHLQELVCYYLNEEQMRQLKLQSVTVQGAKLTAGQLLSSERKDLIDDYGKFSGRFEGKQPPNLPLLVADEIDAIDTAVVLAGEAIKAAGSYRAAHAKLAATVSKKEDLGDVIEEVQVLADEVKTAQKLKKKLDKK